MSGKEKSETDAQRRPHSASFQQTRQARRLELVEDYVELIDDLISARGGAAGRYCRAAGSCTAHCRQDVEAPHRRGACFAAAVPCGTFDRDRPAGLRKTRANATGLWKHFSYRLA